jgi:hypothetical protein
VASRVKASDHAMNDDPIAPAKRPLLFFMIGDGVEYFNERSGLLGPAIATAHSSRGRAFGEAVINLKRQSC